MIDATEVKNILDYCFLNEHEVKDNEPLVPIKKIEGVMNTFGLSVDRLEEKRESIIAILKELPEGFFKNTGGGWSFIQLVVDKDDNQWGEQRNAEQLMVLAMGIEVMTYLMPRNMWAMFEGGMPYVVIDLD